VLPGELRGVYLRAVRDKPWNGVDKLFGDITAEWPVFGVKDLASTSTGLCETIFGDRRLLATLCSEAVASIVEASGEKGCDKCDINVDSAGFLLLCTRFAFCLLPLPLPAPV
jgi:hypothetical protein